MRRNAVPPRGHPPRLAAANAPPPIVQPPIADFEKFKQKVESKDTHIAGLRTTLQEMQDQLALQKALSNQLALNSQTQTHDLLRKKQQKAQEACQTLSQQLRWQTQQSSNLSSTLNVLMGQNKQLSEKIKQLQEIISTLEQDTRQQKEAIQLQDHVVSDYSAQLTREQEKNRALEEENRELRKTIDALKGQQSQKENTLLLQIEHLQKRATEQTEIIGQKTTDIKKLEDSEQTLKKAYQSLLQQKSALDDQISGKAKELLQCFEENAKLKLQLDTALAVSDELTQFHYEFLGGLESPEGEGFEILEDTPDATDATTSQTHEAARLYLVTHEEPQVDDFTLIPNPTKPESIPDSPKST